MKKFMYIIYLIFGKTLGRFMIFAALPFRGYAYNVVFNYVLHKNLPLKRLRERFPVLSIDGYTWVLQDVHDLVENQSPKGFIKYRKIGWLEFYLVAFFIFGWLDPDANDDLTDIGYINSIKVGGVGYRTGGSDRSKDFLFWYRRWLPEFKEGDVVYGSAFDLGDARVQHSFLKAKLTRVEKFFCIYSWASRNSAMGFEYLFFNY